MQPISQSGIQFGHPLPVFGSQQSDQSKLFLTYAPSKSRPNKPII